MFYLFFLRWRLELLEILDQRTIGSVSLLVLGLDRLQDGTKTVKEMETTSNDGCADGELAFAQHPQQVFARVSEPFKAFEAQEASGSLDGMHRTEDVR